MDRSQISSWTARYLQPAPASITDDLAIYERGGLVPSLGGGPDAIGLLWRFRSDPTEPFFTDILLLRGDETIHKERHLAYPTNTWRLGDAADTQILNLFDLPPSVRIAEVTSIAIEHVGAI